MAQELKVYNVVATADVNPEVVDSLGCTEFAAYDADEVGAVLAEKDKEIAELKAENERLKKQSSCTFSDDCLRVRQLKRKLESVQASMYCDVVDANMKIRRLQRALYKACANWAMAESYSILNDVQTSNRWVHALNKCRAKAEEYK